MDSIYEINYHSLPQDYAIALSKDLMIWLLSENRITEFQFELETLSVYPVTLNGFSNKLIVKLNGPSEIIPFLELIQKYEQYRNEN